MPRGVLGGLDLRNDGRIINLVDGTANTDAATVQQVNAARRGLDVKDSVRAVTLTNITLSGTQTIDGVALAVGDRVLVKSQSTATANGIYNVQSAAWTRAVDADENTEVTQGLSVAVIEGTTKGTGASQANPVQYALTTADPITIGTTSLTFAIVGQAGTVYTAGNGITLTGSAFAVNPASGGGIVVAAGGVSVDTAVVVRKFAATIGDGSATSYTVTHNLGTRDSNVTVYASGTPFAEVLVDIQHTDANSITVLFGAAPASGAYRVIVQA